MCVCLFFLYKLYNVLAQSHPLYCIAALCTLSLHKCMADWTTWLWGMSIGSLFDLALPMLPSLFISLVPCMPCTPLGHKPLLCDGSLSYHSPWLYGHPRAGLFSSQPASRPVIAPYSPPTPSATTPFSIPSHALDCVCWTIAILLCSSGTQGTMGVVGACGG